MKSLDEKLQNIHRDPYGAKDFILADAKDADMATGLAATGNDPITGKRRTLSFGWKYDFNDRELKKAEEIPEFLLPLRRRAAVRPPGSLLPPDLRWLLRRRFAVWLKVKRSLQHAKVWREIPVPLRLFVLHFYWV